MFLKDISPKILLIALVFVFIFFLNSPIANSQNWIALPPYNTLWPLWSPALSPVNPVTGIATPIVSSLGSSAVLPLQPGLTWDPSMSYPWLLYNTPLGMVYFDAMYGINTWPPYQYINPMTGIPFPISLPSGYGSLPPTDPTWLYSNVPLGNELYTSSYPYYAFLTNFALSYPLLLPTITPLNISSYITMFNIPADTILVPPVIGADALLGLL